MGAYSFSTFLFIACLIYGANGKQQIEEVITYESRQESCSSVRHEMSELKMKTMCTPRMVLVKLKSEPGYTYYPSVVSVKRCTGSCHSPYSCMATASNLTSVVVKRVNNLDDMSIATCQRIFVKEHTACKCSCDIMEQHCNKKQKYMENDCTCKCINMNEKEKCDSMPNRRWNLETCSCMCDMPEQECSTGLEWVPRYCKCLKLMDGKKQID